MSAGQQIRLAPNAIVKGSDFNRLVDLVEAYRNPRPGPGLSMFRGSAGTFYGALNRRPPSIGGVAADKPSQSSFVATFPAVILDSLGWEDSSSDPDAQPPSNKYVWRYLIHMCYFTADGERCM